MNIQTHTAAELRAARLAAGALAVLLVTFAGLAMARPHQVAAVTPTAPPRSSEMAPPSGPDAALEALGAGDMVRVTVFRNPDLTTEARVSDRGTILFPLIGEVHVTGLTPSQAGTMIARKLRDGKFVVNPEVTVALAQLNSRQVAVLGAVNKPGRYPIDAQNSRLTDFLAAAGGIAPTGAEHVTLVSNQEGKTVKRDIDLNAIFRDGDLTQNVRLQPGDTVYVEKAPMIYIYGEVQKGGAYRLEPNMTVMQALALGGGLTTRGTQRGIKIARHTAEGVREIDARLTDPVKEDDVIYVRESLF
jgi:polysaccharide export outer membrane protein